MPMKLHNSPTLMIAERGAMLVAGREARF